MFCGNGKYEKVYGQQCDDKNKADNDGCSSLCQIESGWSCAANFCQKIVNNFCGDGITEGKEECDDGFPLKGGDGCNILCKVE